MYMSEESVYVKFKVRGEENTHFLAWTTTPWTLPGNVALAVRPDIDYVKVKVGTEVLIIAEARLGVIGEYQLLEKIGGDKLIGLEYESLYSLEGVDNDKAYRIYPADFVNTEEGTGIVHTAMLYGEDDYALGLEVGLPQVPMLDSAGHFNEKVPDLIRGQYFKKAEKIIKEDLEKRNLLFRREMHTHSYPHCHRCGTALLYNAISSWFIKIEKVKDRMIKLNEKINWVPDHLKHGRFLNIVESAPDWTISRNRYWASPLPIWKCNKCKELKVVGSVEELRDGVELSGNKYYLMRHAESPSN